MSGLILYTGEDRRSRIHARNDRQVVRLSQPEMAELFQTSKQNIAKHITSILAGSELHADSAETQWLTTAAEGKKHKTVRAVQAFLAKVQNLLRRRPRP